jgi:hypothetical protein
MSRIIESLIQDKLRLFDGYFTEFLFDDGTGKRLPDKQADFTKPYKVALRRRYHDRSTPPLAVKFTNGGTVKYLADGVGERTGWGNGVVDKLPTFLGNTRKPVFTVGLRQARDLGVEYNRLTIDDLLHTEADQWYQLRVDQNGEREFIRVQNVWNADRFVADASKPVLDPADRPRHGMIVGGNDLLPQKEPADDRYKFYLWHAAGGCLFRYRDTDTDPYRYFVSVVDEGTYCVIELPGKARTVSQGLAMLVPKIMRGGDYIRQGEWFFSLTDTKTDAEIAAQQKMSRTKLKELVKPAPLPWRQNHENRHVCRYVEIGDKIYVTGKVQHMHVRGWPTRQHKTVKTEPGVWMRADVSREIASATRSAAKFD